jgi:hypothetical protein
MAADVELLAANQTIPRQLRPDRESDNLEESIALL